MIGLRRKSCNQGDCVFCPCRMRAGGALERNGLSKARKFEELHAAPVGKSLEFLEPVESSVRALAMPESTEEMKKKRA